jgi:putative component of membrane protein insertase Oxa1/YidC/SpoIIIJ protein YidD
VIKPGSSRLSQKIPHAPAQPRYAFVDGLFLILARTMRCGPFSQRNLGPNPSWQFVAKLKSYYFKLLSEI